MDGEGGRFYGSTGYDVCTDLGDNEFTPWGQATTCDVCFGPGGAAWPLDCATGNPPLPQIVECFRDADIAEGDHCGTCCPACTAVVDSLYDHFEYYDYHWRPTSTECVCLDFAGSYYKDDYNGRIELTSSSDCARITGSDNQVYGMDGNDAIYMNGEHNVLSGMRGKDHLAAGGSGNLLKGGQDNDVCTDLGDNTFEDSGSNACESCFG